jgi:hypothetical protein
MSCYVKAGTKTTCRVGIRDKTGANILANFNLSTVSTTVGNALASAIQDAGDGWYKCTAICASATGVIGQRGLVFMDIGSYTADGTGTLHVWGAQLEAGSTPSSYIPTTTAAVTRNADVASITGSAFSSWYRQDEGSLFMEANTFSTATTGPIWWRVSDGTSANFIRLIRSGAGATPQMQITSGGAGQGSPFTPGISANTFFKNACYYKTDDFGVTTNGSALTGNAIDTLATMPTGIDRLELSATIVNGYYKRLTFWPQRLPNNILQAITQ